MARIIILSIILLVSTTINAAETKPAQVKGYIVTSDNKPAIAVTVQLKGTKQVTLTNNEGFFILNNIPPGYYLLEVISVAHEKLEKAIHVEEGKTVQRHLQLALSQKQLGEVVVTGQYAPQSLRNSVYRVRVIDQATIKMRNATDVLGVLNNELGIRFSTDLTLGETDVQIMGMSGQNVKILLDGIPLIDRNAAKQSLSQIDINSIERIEIVEGPMSVVYGTDALAGVINIITKKSASKASTLAITARVQEETVGKEYNAFANKGVHNANVAIAWQHKGWHADASLTRNNFGGWQGHDTGRAKEWFPKNQWLGSGTVGYRNSKVNIWYRLNYLNEVIHSLGKVTNTMTATDADYITNRYTHQAQFDWFINPKLNLSTSASYQQYARATQTTTYDLITGDRRLSLEAGSQDTSKFNTIFFRSTAQYIISPSVSLQPGIEYQHDEARGQRIEGTPVISNYAFFVSSEIKPVQSINIRPGIRISKNSTYDAPPVIPSINTKFTISKTVDIRAAYARGFRAPALRELYFWFFDANHSIKGNPGLKAEYSNSYSASVTWHPFISNNMVALTSTLTSFYNDFNNRIDLALGQDANNPSVYTYINISKYKTTGGTWQSTFEWKQLTATLGISYIGRYNAYSDDTAYNKEGALPQFTWSPEISSNIMYNFKQIGLQLGLFYKYTGQLPQYEFTVVDNEETVRLAKTASYNWADFNVRKSLGKYLTISTGVKNIFNVTRLNNTSADVGGAHSTGGPVPMSYGRSYFLGLQFSWSH